MRPIIPLLMVISLILLSGCAKTGTKYRCQDGSLVESAELCSLRICPDLDCSRCPKEVVYQEKLVDKEIIKYKCLDGSYKDKISDCDIIKVGQDVNENDSIDYKFSRYEDYATFVRPTLEELTGIKEMGGHYGGTEGKDQLREDGKVYFIIFKHGDWGAVRYWAVEVNAETGELINYKEVTKGENQINYNEIWWYEP